MADLKYKQVVPADFLAVALIHTTTGVPDQQICTFGITANAGEPTEVDMGQVVDAWVDNVLPILFTATTLDRVTFSDAGGLVHEIFPAEAGTNADAPGPISNAVLVEKRTGLSGRHNRGRLYLMGVGEPDVGISGTLDSTFRTNCQTNMDAFLADVETALDGGDGGMYLLHSKSWPADEDPPADPGNAPAPTKVSNLFVAAKIGTQRRRLR